MVVELLEQQESLVVDYNGRVKVKLVIRLLNGGRGDPVRHDSLWKFEYIYLADED